MSHIAESIACGRIARIENYENKEGLSVREVLRRTGADWAMNSIMYNRDGSPCSHLKADGKTVYRPDYNVWGLAWNSGADIHPALLPAAGEPDLPEWNYIGGVNLIRDGEKVEKPIYALAQGGTRGRTAWGMKNGRFCGYCSKDGSIHARTPEELGELLEDYGWEFCAMGDCGGSSQAVLNGREIRADRIVRYLLLIYLDRPTAYEPTVKAYSRERDGKRKLSEHFSVWEFACGDGSDPVFISDALVQVLEAIRQHFGTVHITSGYRTPGHNRKVGGKATSQHLYGLAADIVIDGVSPAEVGRYARSIMPNHGGVGIYDKKKHFTHIDVRAHRADWRE